MNRESEGKGSGIPPVIGEETKGTRPIPFGPQTHFAIAQGNLFG
jgi:hypothetical protein